MAVQIQSVYLSLSAITLSLSLVAGARAQDQRCFKDVKVKVPDAQLEQLISLPKLGVGEFYDFIGDVTELKDGTVVIPQINNNGGGSVITFVNPAKGYEKKTITLHGQPDEIHVLALKDGGVALTVFETIRDKNGDTIRGESKVYISKSDGTQTAAFDLPRPPDQIFESPKGELIVSHGEGHEYGPRIDTYDRSGKLLRKVEAPAGMYSKLGQASDGTLFALGRNDNGQRATMLLMNPDGSLRKSVTQAEWYSSPVSMNDGTIAVAAGPYDKLKIQRISTSGDVKESYPVRSVPSFDTSFSNQGGLQMLNDGRAIMLNHNGIGIATREGDTFNFVHTNGRHLPIVLRDGKLLLRSPVRDNEWSIRNVDGGEYLSFNPSTKLLMHESPTSSIQTRDGKLWSAGYQGKGARRDSYHIEVRKIVEGAKEVTKRVPVDCQSGEVISESGTPATH